MTGAAPSSRSDAEAGLDLALRQKLRERDEEALAVFFDAYFDRVYGYVRRLVGEDHLAEDLTQEVFLHVHRSLPSYDPARELRPWVFTIATNKVRDLWRSRRHQESRRETSVDEDGAADRLPGTAELPDADLTRGELEQRVRAAIDDLPEGLRTTLVLRVYEGLSFQRIGELVERNEVAVRKRYSRALERLRASLGRAWEVFAEGT